jgi:hypothetical protein
VHSAFHLFRAEPRVNGVADVVSRYDTLHPAIFTEDYDLGGIAEGQVCRGVFQGGWRAGLGREITDVVPRVLSANQLIERELLEIGG